MTATVESCFGGSGETGHGLGQPAGATGKRQGSLPPESEGRARDGEPASTHGCLTAERTALSLTFSKHLQADAGVASLPVRGVQDVAIVGALILQLHVLEGEGHIVFGGVPSELHPVPKALQLLVHDLHPELQELGSPHGRGGETVFGTARAHFPQPGIPLPCTSPRSLLSSGCHSCQGQDLLAAPLPARTCRSCPIRAAALTAASLHSRLLILPVAEEGQVAGAHVRSRLGTPRNERT